MALNDATSLCHLLAEITWSSHLESETHLPPEMGTDQENITHFTGLQGERQSTLKSKVLYIYYQYVWNECYYTIGFHRISVFKGIQKSIKSMVPNSTEVSETF